MAYQSNYDVKLDKVLKEFKDVAVELVNNVADYSYKFRIKSYNNGDARLVITKTFKDRKSEEIQETPKIGRIPAKVIPEFIDRLEKAQDWFDKQK